MTGAGNSACRTRLCRKSVGRVRSFFGNVGILFRGYCYIRTLGPDGLKAVSENAVLNANYLLSHVRDAYEVPHGDRCMHEFVASARGLRRERKVSAMDIGKRLLTLPQVTSSTRRSSCRPTHRSQRWSARGRG